MNQEPAFMLRRDSWRNCLEVIYSNYINGSCSIRFVLKKPTDKALKHMSGDLKRGLYGS